MRSATGTQMVDDRSKTAPGTCAHCRKPAVRRCTGCVKAPVYAESASQPTFYCDSVCQKADRPQHKSELESFKPARRLPESRCFSKPSSTGFDFMPRHYNSSRCASKVQPSTLKDFSRVDWTLNGS